MRRAIRTLAVTVVVLLLAACAADAGVSAWLEGTWTCQIARAGDPWTDATMTVGTTAWVLTFPEDVGIGERRGHWTLAGGMAAGGLLITMDGVHDDYVGAGTILGLPLDAADLPTADLTTQWTGGGGPGPEPLTISKVTADSVQLTYTATNGTETVTTCQKG